jgi:nitric oxide reductase NorQ protein
VAVLVHNFRPGLAVSPANIWQPYVVIMKIILTVFTNSFIGGTMQNLEEYMIGEKPFYLAQGDELAIAEAAYAHTIPLLLKGPTGCGKTRFMQHLAWQLKRPLVTVACHDDLSTSDLVGRYLVKGGEAVWVDGPLTMAVRGGAICYLDEIVEARKDTTVVIHPLADDRRALPIEKLGELIQAPPEFMLAISYNPGYQSVLKDLKQSTRQRFISIEFNYPEPELETDIVQHESGVERTTAESLVRLAVMTRNLRDAGLPEGASTRLLIHAGKLMQFGMKPRRACRAAISETLTDDHELLASINEMINSLY